MTGGPPQVWGPCAGWGPTTLRTPCRGETRARVWRSQEQGEPSPREGRPRRSLQPGLCGRRGPPPGGRGPSRAREHPLPCSRLFRVLGWSRTHVCICTGTGVHTVYVSMHMRTHTFARRDVQWGHAHSTHIDMHVCGTHVSTHVCSCAHTHVGVCTPSACVSVRVRALKHVHTSTWASTLAHTCTHRLMHTWGVCRVSECTRAVHGHGHTQVVLVISTSPGTLSSLFIV